MTFDTTKRQRTAEERGLDFADADEAFAGTPFEADDERQEDGERRVICFGWLRGRKVGVGHTPRGADRHGFSRRKAHEREQARLPPLLGIEPGDD